MTHDFLSEQIQRQVSLVTRGVLIIVCAISEPRESVTISKMTNRLRMGIRLSVPGEYVLKAVFMDASVPMARAPTPPALISGNKYFR